MYQCCADYTTIEGVREAAENLERQFEFDFEYLIDAKLTFKHKKAETVEEKQEIDTEKDTRRCFFTRVHINDMDLLNKGDMKEKEMKRRKQCVNFLQKVRKLGFSVDLNLSEEMNNADEFSIGQPSEFPASDISSLGILDHVKFNAYPSRINLEFNKEEPHRKEESQNEESAVGIKSEPNEEVICPTTSKDQSNSWSHLDTLFANAKKEQQKGMQQELTMDQKLQFNFAYDEERDKRLLAKNAKRYFGKDKDMQKYWHQRYRYFSKIDEGCLMDREGWFSVTPELLAEHVADRLVRIMDCTILDAFTGVGGNAIQFALRGAFVFAIDIDPVKLVCAKQNASIYGASDRINFICGDFFHIIQSMLGARWAKELREVERSNDPYPFGIDAIFLSPPWGGPSYTEDRDRGVAFDIEKCMGGLSGAQIFQMARRITPNIVYFLPLNTSVDQLIALAGPNGRVELEQAVLNRKVKALNAYYGRLVSNDQ